MVWWVPGHAPRDVQPGLPLKLKHVLDLHLHIYIGTEVDDHTINVSMERLSQDLTHTVIKVGQFSEIYLGV